MFRTIIAGTDGVERGRNAVALAHELAWATDSRLVIVGVHPQSPMPLAAAHAAACRELTRRLRDLRNELAPEALVLVAADMSPARALRRVAEDQDAGLIVVGAHERRPLERLVEGEPEMKILRGSPPAVAVVPDHLARVRIPKVIGVGVDATPESAVALELAHDLARRTGAQLWLHAVIDDRTPGWMDPSGRETATAVLRAAVDRCDDVCAKGHLLSGNPAEELAAISERFDLLVMGSRRFGRVRRVAIGSTSESVIRHAACPVLVPARHATAEQFLRVAQASAGRT
jgi:nucleotide-binding universal stress UspA family protein